MAKCGITNISGGGGIGSDELSVTADKVVEGNTYVGADTNDEIGAGTLVDRPSTTGAISVARGGADNNYIFTRIPKGAYRTATGTGYPEVTALQSDVATAGGLSADKIMAGKSAFGMNGTATNDSTAAASDIRSGAVAYMKGVRTPGTMPDFSKTATPIDAVRISNNRFEVAVVRGYHGYSWADNGYEYMSFDQVANAIGLTAAKLKKGEVVCGKTGTFEGYIAETLDLYNRGAWGSIAASNLNPKWANQGDYRPGTLRYDPAQIALVTGDSVRYQLSMLIAKSFNTINYSYFNVTVICAQSLTQMLRIECGTGYQDSGTSWGITNRLGDTGAVGFSSTSTEATITLNLSNINSIVYFLLTMYPNTGATLNKDSVYIRRIWFS